MSAAAVGDILCDITCDIMALCVFLLVHMSDLPDHLGTTNR